VDSRDRQKRITTMRVGEIGDTVNLSKFLSNVMQVECVDIPLLCFKKGEKDYDY
jgi:hypothetical protein